MISEARKNELYEKMIAWICEHISDDEDLYNTLTDYFEMSKDEIREWNVELPEDYFTATDNTYESVYPGISVTDFIEKVGAMTDGEDKTAVLDWIEFAGFLRDCGEDGERTLETELYELYLPLCYVQNNFDNAVLQQSLRLDTLGNEIIFSAMLFGAGYSESQIREFADSGIIEDGYIPISEDEKGSLSLLLITGEEERLYLSRRGDLKMADYAKTLASIFPKWPLPISETLSDPVLGGIVLREISHPALLDAVRYGFEHSTAFSELAVFDTEQHNVSRYDAGAMSEELNRFEIQQNEFTEEKTSDYCSMTIQ